jgi:hypothetical protein
MSKEFNRRRTKLFLYLHFASNMKLKEVSILMLQMVVDSSESDSDEGSHTTVATQQQISSPRFYRVARDD